MQENPYKAPTTEPSSGPRIWRRHAYAIRQVTGFVLYFVGLLWIPLYFMEEPLLKTGVLNAKDLSPLVGNRTGTISEYVLNVWHWGAICFLLMLASLPCLCTGAWISRRRKSDGE